MTQCPGAVHLEEQRRSAARRRATTPVVVRVTELSRDSARRRAERTCRGGGGGRLMEWRHQRRRADRVRLVLGRRADADARVGELATVVLNTELPNAFHRTQDILKR